MLLPRFGCCFSVNHYDYIGLTVRLNHYTFIPSFLCKLTTSVIVLFYRNTDTWTTSCLRTTPPLIASWTSGGRLAASAWATCTAGTQSTRTSPWASGPRWQPSTSPHRWENEDYGGANAVVKLLVFQQNKMVGFFWVDKYLSRLGSHVSTLLSVATFL